MKSGGIQIRVSDLLFAVQKRWKMIVALTFVGLLFGLLLSGMTYVRSSSQTYEVSGSFIITTNPVDGAYLSGASQAGYNDFHLPEDMVDVVTYLIKSDRVIDEAINRQKLLGVTADQVRAALGIRQFNATQILEMSLSWSSGEEGVGLWEALVAATNELLPRTVQMGSLAVINEAQVQRIGAGSGGMSLWAVLAVLGFAAGVGYALMEMLMHPTLTNVKDVENLLGLETIGMIPRNEQHFKIKGSLLSDRETASPEVIQSYSAAAYILRNRLGVKEKHHCFYVTSATGREGRSSVAANLAIQLSDMEHRTLLIDFDTRNPSLGSLFLNQVDYAHSLNALYRGEAGEAEAITTLTGYLDILPTVLEHNAIPMDGTVIELISRLREKYEYVILDAPPVGRESDTLSLNQVAGTVLFVVGYDSATVPEIQASLDTLDKSGIRVLGCIVNGVQSGRFRSGGSDETKKRISTKKRKKDKAEQEMGIEPQETPDREAPKAPGDRRSPMEELMTEEAPERGMTDQEAVNELLKIGIRGEFKSDEGAPQDEQ